MARALQWDYSYIMLKLAQLLGELGVFLTCSAAASAAVICDVSTGGGGLARSVASPASAAAARAAHPPRALHPPLARWLTW
jgi:hypothetical protein